MELKEQLILIDGNSLINRAYFALPLLTAKDGSPSGAVYGFANILVRMITEYRPKYIAVAFDEHAPTFRHKMYDGYKATRRGMPDDLAAQMPVLKEMLDLMNICHISRKGIEADDIIGTIAKAHETKTLILTGDRDSFQLIDDSTSVLFTRKGISEVEVMTRESLVETMGLSPSQIIDYKSLAGDSSDNIPGIGGIGDKRATELLKKYGSVENIYAHLDEITGSLGSKLENGKDMCDLSYRLATIKTDCDIKYGLRDMTYSFPFSPKVHSFFESMDFKSLARKKDLFTSRSAPEEAEKPVYIPIDVITLTSASQLAVALKDIKEFAVTFGSVVSVSTDGTTQYNLPVRESLLDGYPTDAEIVKEIAPFLSDPSVRKYVYDAKKDMKYLSGFGVGLEGYDDVALMEYLSGSQFKTSTAGGYAESLGLTSSEGAAALMRGGKDVLSRLDELNMTALYRDLELPLVEVLYRMEKIGFQIDLAKLKELKTQFDRDEKACADEICLIAGKNFNINSPKQLSVVLFDDLGLPYPKRAGMTARGIKSTSADILAHIKDEHRIVPVIIKYRYIAKLNSTYLDGLGKLAGADGVVHTEFNQTQTTTGRLSSSEPNLQNIPVREDEGRILRGMFVARGGNKLVSADYSQIELRVMAHLSGDENLIRAFNAGEDVHTSVARELFGTDNPTERERRTAKTVNFGIIYGMSAFGLSERLDIPPKEAKAYIEKYFERFPGVKSYLSGVVEEARKLGYAESLFGRRRSIPELNSSNYQQRGFGERAAMNMPLQSTAADIIKAAMLKVDAALTGMKSKLILQVHDELIVDAPQDEVDEVTAILRREMETAVTLRVPLVVEIKAGRSWLDCK